MPEKSIPWSELYAMQVRLNLTLSIIHRADGYVVSMVNNGILYSSYLPRPSPKSPASTLPINAAADLLQFESAFIIPPQPQIDIANNLAANNIVVDASLSAPIGSEEVDVIFSGVSNSKKTVYNYLIPQGKILTLQKIWGTCATHDVGVLFSVYVSDDGISPTKIILLSNMKGNLVSESLSEEIFGDGVRTVMIEKETNKRGKVMSTVRFKGYLK